MTITAEREIEVSDDSIEERSMEFDPEGIAHLASILSNQASNRAKYVLQEYWTNAVDSHVMARQKRAVDVTLPTRQSPVLVLTDYGVGLSREEMIAVYTKYAKSTKTNSKTQVGRFGIGAKSAFTLSSQFTVTARKDGKQTVVLLYLNEDNQPKYRIVSHTDTDQPNGVTVSVPVSDPAPFKDAATEVFGFADPALVNCPGIEIGVLRRDYEETFKGIWMAREPKPSDRDDLFVLMGLVRYPVSQSIIDFAKSKIGMPGDVHTYGMTIEVPIESVDIVPSRESLMDTGRTVDAVGKALTKWGRAVGNQLRSDLEAATNLTDALMALGNMKRLVPSLADLGADLTWRGQKFYGNRIINNLTPESGSKLNEELSFERPAEGYVVLVDASASQAASLARRFRFYRENNPQAHTLVFAAGRDQLDDGVTWGEGTSWTNVMTVEEFREQSKAPRGRYAGQERVSFTYSSYILGDDEIGSSTLAELRALGEKVVIVPSSRPLSDVRKVLEKAELNAVFLTGNQTAEAAHKRLPQAQPYSALHPVIDAMLEDFPVEMLDTVEFRSFTPYRGEAGIARAIAKIADRLDDPRFGRVQRVVEIASKLNEAEKNLISDYETLRRIRDLPLASSSFIRTTLECYPLLRLVSSFAINTGRHDDDLVIYLNAAYAAQMTAKAPDASAA